jgi:thioredoxin 2
MVTLRCPFCLTLNRVDASRVADRPRCGKCERPLLLDRPVKVTEEDFGKTVLESELPVLVDFYADWCQPCKVVAPVVDEIAREHQGKLLVAKVDSDHAPRISMQYGIRGIPTLILYRGGAELGRVVGADGNGIRELVKQHLASAA